MITKSFLTYYSRHEHPVLNQNDAFVRKVILDFKVGAHYAQNLFAEYAAQFLYDTFSYDEMSNLIAVSVPASDTSRDVQRYSRFFTEFGYLTGIRDMYTDIYPIGEQEPSHELRANGEDNGERVNFGIFRGEEKFKGKNVVIFDDIRTTGKSLEKVRKALEECGANVVCMITLAQTK